MAQIFKSMQAINKEIEAIQKGRSGDGINYNFRGIDDMMNSLHPLMAKHGVVTVPKVIDRKADYFDKTKEYQGRVSTTRWTQVVLTVEWRFTAEDGSELIVGPVCGEGLDNSDKATNKAMSAAFKYALMQTFMVPTEDVAEGDAESPENGPSMPSESEVRALLKAFEGLRISKTQVLERYKLKDEAELDRPQVDELKAIGKQIKDKTAEPAEFFTITNHAEGIKNGTAKKTT